MLKVTSPTRYALPRPLRLSPVPRCARRFTSDAPSPHSSTDLLDLYRQLVADGRLKWDDEQVRCIMKLRHLLKTLGSYSPPLELLAKLSPVAPFIAQQQKPRPFWWNLRDKSPSGLGIDTNSEDEKGLVRVLSGEEELANLTTPKGFCLVGPPGTGKSLLLSLFYDLLPISKCRVHYHAFTLELYKQVFEEISRNRSFEEEEYEKVMKNKEMAARKGWKSVFAGGRWDEQGGERVMWTKEEGMTFNIARKMILRYSVLYFDEFQLIDATAAALIRDVLSWYWRLGGVILTCSNRVPEDLYHHGVQRERLSGFLDALKARCEVVQVDGGRDWRLNDVKGDRTRWYKNADAGFEGAWKEATSGCKVESRTITVYGRPLKVAKASDSACRFTFAELCEEALGPADYLALVSTFKTFFIDEVPTLYLRHKNEARRFINLIDALYESRCQLHLRTPASPFDLFFPDALALSSEEQEALTNERMMSAEALSATLQVPYRPNVSYYNNLTSSQQNRENTEAKKKGSSFSVLGIWTGEDEKFAYKRAVSRLIEMTTSSAAYASEAWRPLSGTLWQGDVDRSGPQQRPLFADTQKRHEASISKQDERPSSDPLLLKIRTKKQADALPPVIKEQHVWGVADEWGKGAGRWGQGVKAYERVDTIAEHRRRVMPGGGS
ncbi:hypothetical protein B9479_006419 [Cryptococcus floricola]|uniref:AAA+ ATPase domain-containing protein n=1 Tax=Cryptococcus floricola TaxID=2591691 RepID=A0A5D3ASB3_9TREE|nr:hypothetical protein B9479_006419 [Cryptococcus floricola]